MRTGKIKAAIIGAGLQGTRYASALRRLPDTEIALIADADHARATSLAKEVGAEAVVQWEGLLERPDIAAVLICTPPHLHAPMAIAAMKAGKHVLCEKPLALTLEDAQAMLRIAQEGGVVLGCGLNYRHHPGIRQAKEWFDQGLIGELIFMRCRHGIVGRPGYEKEWRAKAEFAGGGHLMEQGIHILDLFHWFAGEFQRAVAFTATNFWDMAPQEDNGFALLETRRGQIASLHSSLTQWHNLFSFEIYGRDGYVQVEGLGGSYGTERAILGKRDFHKPFTEEVVEFRGPDNSFAETWQEFVQAIRGERELCTALNGYQVLRVVLALYESARMGQVVDLAEAEGQNQRALMEEA